MDAGHRAIIYNRIGGIQEGVKAEGTHLLFPWVERPIIYDVRTKPRTVSSLTGSRGKILVCAYLNFFRKVKFLKYIYIYNFYGSISTFLIIHVLFVI